MLTEVLHHAIGNGDRDYLAEGTFQPDGWIQVTYAAINLSYASTTDPAVWPGPTVPPPRDGDGDGDGNRLPGL
ncbi:hypothetical protein U746_1095 [Mycolicibacterium mucogenicum 261Sha1.1M5]|uniref:hypothetical protein n=1 Tax=Leucobacter aridicollis TaxID=283878 RepID=UPI000EB1B937|nr:hypothetical protein [Leucobacter aridicollis]MCS3428689.1 hypothetical protein [Leucobacter aridicollis]RKQ89851.1 hypothetical protein U746_1095 [Mycolicibacterium mucogenicum 261Sha1.1M5]